jgi:hypothetical protein
MVLGANGLGLFNSEHLLGTAVRLRLQNCALLNRRNCVESSTLVELVAVGISAWHQTRELDKKALESWPDVGRRPN